MAVYQQAATGQVRCDSDIKSIGMFQGFSPELFSFLESLQKNNQREWFVQHKTDYEASVLEPGLDLVRSLQRPLEKLSPCFTAVAKRTGGSVMRIYRDTRFSRDKTPYKTNLGIQFRHQAGKDVHAPGFYFHVSPDECFVAGGIWRPASAELNQIRAMIDSDSQRWNKVIRQKPFRESFQQGGDSLQRPPRGYDPGHPLLNDLKRKDHIAVATLPRSTVLDPKLTQHLVRHFKVVFPYVRFLCDALNLPS